MNKVTSAIFGIAVGVIVYLVLILGIQTFYPEPDYDDYCESREPQLKCQVNDTECYEENQKCYDEYSEARENYESNFFIIAAIIGLLTIVVAFFTLNMINISSGLIMAGVILIVFGFMRGWNATNDITKFVFALIDAVVIIGFAVYLNKKK